MTLLELHILLGACDLAALVSFRNDVPNSAPAAVCTYIYSSVLSQSPT